MIHRILAPFLWLLRLLSYGKNSDHRTLVIQTAKIGDCLNSTPLLYHLGNFDIICEGACQTILQSFPGLQDIYRLNDYRKGGLHGKLRLAFKLFFNRYSVVYVLQPNSLNLFLAEMATPDSRVGIDVDYKRNYVTKRFCSRNRCITHGKEDLVLDTYLKMLPSAESDRKKHYYGIISPDQEHDQLVGENLFYIGISLSAGNKMKSLPEGLTCTLLRIINGLNDVRVLFFGVEGEENYLRSIEKKGCLDSVDYISLIGTLDLGESAWFLCKINLFISSDTGLSYLADTLDVPLINFMGPCSYNEQRPLGDNALIVKTPGLETFSFIFDAPYHSDLSSNEMYQMDNESLNLVEKFIGEIYRDFQSH